MNKLYRKTISIDLDCPSKFRDKPEGCERNLGVVTLKSEHFAGGDDTAAECETRLDGVLNEYSGQYGANCIPKIKEGADNFIKTLNKKYDLILFTTRNFKMAEKWLIENNLNKYFKAVTSEKQPCYLYIDDRALKFDGDYKQTLKEIDNFEVYWKTKQ